MSQLVITAIGPASSVQDGGRPGSQRYGLVPSGAMDRLALATANCLVGNAVFAAAIEIGPVGAVFTARGGAVRVALAGAARSSADIAKRPVAINTSMTLAEGESLTLGFARGGTFSYLAIEGGVQGEPMFGSLSVNARAGLGSPWPRPLQPGDTLEVASASDVQERGIDLPAPPNGPVRVVMGPQDDEFGDATKLFVDSEWKISATSDRMGYRLEGPVINHLHGHNIVSDGTVNGSIQVPGNGAPIVLMPDRGTSGGYPKVATVITADFGRFAQTPAGQPFRFKAVSMAEAQAEARKFAELLRTLPDRVYDLQTSVLDLDALQSANVAGAAVNAVDSRTWQPEVQD
jgi:biotin-dependent carboxylase-like uncharacterized protein